MSFRVWLFSSTFLTSLASGLFGVAGAHAGDIQTADLPAVDGINGKAEVLGGDYATKGLAGGAGSITVPLGEQFGAQFDGAVGSFDTRFLSGGAAHLFWRNPQQGLLGVYGDYSHWDDFGGINVGHVGAESEAYLGQWTVSGVVGAETGNNGVTTAIFAIPHGFITTPNGAPASVTRFYDRLTLRYYITDDWSASIGQRYLGGRDALSVGSEYALASNNKVLTTLFAEGRVGEGSNNYGVWGGMRFYFGNSNKSLIRRNREDDPSPDTSPDSLFDIASQVGNSAGQGQCTGEFHFNGTSCITNPSDRKLKCEIGLLARLDSGIGIYRYRYLWSDAVYVGVMAQEVAEIRPDAIVLTPDGYYRVDYDRLGLRLMAFDEWVAQDRTTALAQPA